MIDLPPYLMKLYDALNQKGDVPIVALAEVAGLKAEEVRNAQQFLGSYFTRMNRRLAKHKMKVVPGRTKQTYRLIVL